MSKVSSVLRKVDGGYAHWCNGCHQMHKLPDNWTFVNNDLEKPTFTPSFSHEGIKRVFVNNKWTGEWEKDGNGNPVPFTCHYVLTNGQLHYQNDCTHSLVNLIVDIPKLPEGLTDEQL